MLSNAFAVALSLAAVVNAAPTSLYKRALAAYSEDVNIIQCNDTQVTKLKEAMTELVNITTFARNYVTANGAEDPVYQRYFGTGDYVSVIGALDALLLSNKKNVTFRCDDPDGNCANMPTWAGHWRGDNATQETVICPLSFEIREPLSEFCENNYTVAGSNPSSYFALDLVHRLYHIPSISDSEVDHVDGGDTYAEVLELAEHNGTWTPFNTHTIQYFMAEVYANEVARPGVGCTGEVPVEDHDHDQTTAASGTATSSAPTECHTHADGATHCV